MTTLLDSGNPALFNVTAQAPGPAGALPLTEDMLQSWPSGHLFGLSQDAGMGWEAGQVLGDEYLLLSTLGGMRSEDGKPIALGLHTGHWEVGLLIREAAKTIRKAGGVPYATYCSDPCDGRTQGTTGMFDSLAYRNEAAIVFRRMIRSLPRRKGILGAATCDKGLPAMMMALAGCSDLPGILVPGGVTLPAAEGEDAGKVQTIGARFARKELSLQDAAQLGCRACATPGGGCQFLGTAASSQVVGEALGLSLPHSALAPSGQPIWLDMARRSAAALLQQIPLREILTDASIRNAMIVHAAFGGSTNMILHLPAIAHAAGLRRPTVGDWTEINQQVPRIVDAIPNGPHPTIRVFLAGGVPEVMLHLRDLNLLDLSVKTVSGKTLRENLSWWETSERRAALQKQLKEKDVILSPDRAREKGLTSTVCFPTGNIAPEGSVIKSTAIDPKVVDADGVYRKSGPARVFTREKDAMAAIKGQTDSPLQPGDVLVLMGRGPMGAGMEEIAQVTTALRHLSWGHEVAVLTDARFSGVSTGACIGHISPEALAGGPLGKLREGDEIEITIDRNRLRGTVHTKADLENRTSHPDLSPDPSLPNDTRLWAVLQHASGGTWGGCVWDVDNIEALLKR